MHGGPDKLDAMNGKRVARWSVLLVVALLVAACAGEEPEAGPASGGGDKAQGGFNQSFQGAEAYPVFVSSEIVVGENRFLMGLLNDQDAPIGSPKIDVSIDFFDLDESQSTPASSSDLGFIWIDKPYRGLYQETVSFPSAGRWGAEVAIRGQGIDETLKAGFEVSKESSTPAIGATPPASDTLTSKNVGKLTQISTDKHPTPDFYDMSIAEALKAGRPSVVVFATPKFCASATCGPTLDIVKSAAKSNEDVNFVHVEPYELPADPSNLKAVPAVSEWGLPSEPWVFVMDADGRVAAKYEGILSAEELKDQLAGL